MERKGENQKLLTTVISIAIVCTQFFDYYQNCSADQGENQRGDVCIRKATDNLHECLLKGTQAASLQKLLPNIRKLIETYIDDCQWATVRRHMDA